MSVPYRELFFLFLEDSELLILRFVCFATEFPYFFKTELIFVPFFFLQNLQHDGTLGPTYPMLHSDLPSVNRLHKLHNRIFKLHKQQWCWYMELTYGLKSEDFEQTYVQ
jgi:hypothetical protein